MGKGAARIEETTHAITLRGAILGWAIMNAIKKVENRAFHMKGYYFLHVGRGKMSKVDLDRIYDILERGGAKRARDEELPRGVILGVVHVQRHYRYGDTESDDPWATGPVCNVIDAVYPFDSPVPAAGALSVWSLAAKDKAVWKSAQLKLKDVAKAAKALR